MFSRNGSVTITNSTLAGNTANDGGGEFFAVGDSDSGSGFTGGDATVQIDNSILANSTGANDFASATVGTGAVTSAGVGDLIVSNAASGGFAGTIVSSADPGLSPLADNGGPTQTMAISAASAAHDAGDDAAAAAAGLTVDSTDQRGVRFRPGRRGTHRIAAYEYLPPSQVLSSRRWTTM